MAAGVKPRSVPEHCSLLTQCRMCGSTDLAQFLDLGWQPLANAFLDPASLATPEPLYPLRVVFCPRCHLVQLREVVDASVLFRRYVYFSSGMPASQHFQRYAKTLVDRCIASPRELVIEIGSNDGHFLAEIKRSGTKVLGVDPAENIAKLANDRGIPTIPEFFSAQLAADIVGTHGQAKVIVANNVVAHIADHHDLIAGVKTLLAPDGVFVLEAPYLGDMVENLAFDSIYHEHRSYLAVRPLATFLGQFGLELFDVQLHPIQGISLRAFIGHRGAHAVLPAVGQLLERERRLRLHDFSTYQEMARRIAALKAEVVEVVAGLKRQGKRLAAYGAPARGNTLLNYFGIGAETLDYATEELPSKIGLYTPGVRIPVVDVRWARQHPPDYFLLLAWNYGEVVRRKEEAFIRGGGKFILPVGPRRLL